MALQRRSADREEKHWLKATLNPDGLISELPPGLAACPGSPGRGGSAPAEKGTSFKWNIHLKLFYLEIISD